MFGSSVLPTTHLLMQGHSVAATALHIGVACSLYCANRSPSVRGWNCQWSENKMTCNCWDVSSTLLWVAGVVGHTHTSCMLQFVHRCFYFPSSSPWLQLNATVFLCHCFWSRYMYNYWHTDLCLFASQSSASMMLHIAIYMRIKASNIASTLLHCLKPTSAIWTHVPGVTLV